MPEVTLDAVALQQYLPHRGVNILPDSVTLSADRIHAVSRTRVLPDDARGRQLCARHDADGACWYEPFLGELMALTGVPLVHDRLGPLGQVAVFSSISALRMERLAPMAHEVVGYASITRDRGSFTIFTTHAEVDGVRFLEAEVMSGVAMLSDLSKGHVRSERPEGTPIDPALFAWKPAASRFIDSLISADRESGRLVAGYRYPVDHPLVPGHFPGAPIMMGVTQWAAVADAAWLARATFGIPGPVLANGSIKRLDGSEILNVRDLVIGPDTTRPGATGAPRIPSTKRIAFRDVVLPGDGMQVEVTVKAL